MFKAIRTKYSKQYVKSGDCPSLFRLDHDFELLLAHLSRPKEDYEIITVELTVVEEPEMVTITKKEYESLKKDSLQLMCLKSWGVDNWDGFSGAMEDYHAELEEE